MRGWSLTLCALLLAGCASSGDVKQASADVDLALEGLREAQEEYAEVFLRELDATQDVVADAIVADAVVQVVATLAAEELNGDLIAISAAMRAERDVYRELTAAVLRTRPKADEPPEDVVQRVLDRQAAGLRAAARALDDAGMQEAAAVARQRAEVMKAGAALLPQYEDLVVLAVLQIAKTVVRQGSDDLGAYIEVMQLVHAQVDEWISTDVKVSGADVAALVESYSGVLAGGTEPAGGAGGGDGGAGGGGGS